MATIALIAIGTGMALKAVSQIKEGQAASATAQFNARLAEMGAESERVAAEFEIKTLEQAGKFEEAKLKREKLKTLGMQRVAYAKGGVRLEGSPLEVMADTAAQYELDIAANRYNVQTGIATTRYGMEVGVSKYRSQAEQSRLMAKRYKTAGYLGAGSTLLTAAGTMGLGYGAAVKGGGAGASTQAFRSGGYARLTY